jgi:DNA-binding GntR family transcriptional regulator
MTVLVGDTMGLVSEELRLRILAYLRLQAAAGSVEPVKDEVLAAKTGVSVEEIRRELDLLEATQLIDASNRSGARVASISARGGMFLDEAIGSMSPEERRRIAFDPSGQPPGFR